GVFQAADHALGVLAPNDLAVPLPGMAENSAEQMRPATPAVGQDPGAASEVHLHLLSGSALHAPKRQLEFLRKPPGKAFDRLISAHVSVLPHQVLVDPLRREPRLQTRLDLS